MKTARWQGLAWLMVVQSGWLPGGEPAPVAGPSPALPGDGPAEQRLIGPPYFSFGRFNAETNLPGYTFGTVSYTHQFSSGFDDRSGGLGSDEVSVWAPVLPVNLDRFHLLGFFNYEATWFDSAVSELPESDLHVFQFPAAFIYDISERWIAGGFVMPGYRGESSSWNSEGFSISAALGAFHACSPRFNIGAGVYYFNGFNESYAVPGAAFTWRPTRDYEVFLLPPMGGVSYSIDDRTILSLLGSYDSGRWNIAADGAGPERNIYVRNVRAGVKLERHLFGLAWGYLHGGYSFLRKLEIDDQDENSLVDEDIKPGPFLQVGLNARF